MAVRHRIRFHPAGPRCRQLPIMPTELMSSAQRQAKFLTNVRWNPSLGIHMLSTNVCGLNCPTKDSQLPLLLCKLLPQQIYRKVVWSLRRDCRKALHVIHPAYPIL